jgi:hypothetical protein
MTSFLSLEMSRPGAQRLAMVSGRVSPLLAPDTLARDAYQQQAHDILGIAAAQVGIHDLCHRLPTGGDVMGDGTFQGIVDLIDLGEGLPVIEVDIVRGDEIFTLGLLGIPIGAKITVPPFEKGGIGGNGTYLIIF